MRSEPAAAQGKRRSCREGPRANKDADTRTRPHQPRSHCRSACMPELCSRRAARVRTHRRASIQRPQSAGSHGYALSPAREWLRWRSSEELTFASMKKFLTFGSRQTPVQQRPGSTATCRCIHSYLNLGTEISSEKLATGPYFLTATAQEPAPDILPNKSPSHVSPYESLP